MEYLAEEHKKYYEFLKANYVNLDFIDAEAIRAENATAGAELEKTIANLKTILDRPFGKNESETEFDPLNLQKDLVEKSKPSALGFLKKSGGTKEENLLGNDLDLLNTDLSSGASAQNKPSSEQPKQKKHNALNFLGKKSKPQSEPTPVQDSQEGLLGLDLMGGPSSTAPAAAETTAKTAPAANLDLFDLSGGMTTEAPSSGVTMNTGVTFNKGTEKASKPDDAFDLLNFDAGTKTEKPSSVPTKQDPNKDPFDFGL